MKHCELTLALVIAATFAAAATAQQEYFVADQFAGEIFRLRDLNGDDDALDVGENTLWATGLVFPQELHAFGSGILAVDEGAAEIVRFIDLNGDGDALDVGESSVWADGFVDPIGLSVGAGGAVYTTDFLTGELWRLEDLNGDGDALDIGERTLYADTFASPLSVLARHADVVVGQDGLAAVRRVVDGNGDGDALDVGENLDHTPPLIAAATGLAVDRVGGAYFVSAFADDIVFRVEDANGDGDAMDVAEVLSYVDPVFGGIDGPTQITRYAGGGLLIGDFFDEEIALARDINGDGDALDSGEVVRFADVDDPSGLAVGIGPGSAGSMIVIQDGAGTLDIAAPNFIAIVDQSTVDRVVINSVLDSGTDALVSSDNPASFAQGNIGQNANAPINKTGGGGATLSIRADGDIQLNAGITSTAGELHVQLIANDTAQTAHDLDPTAGDVDLNGAIDTNGGDLTTSGVDFDNTGGPVTADDVTMTHTGTITLGAALAANTLDISATDGLVIAATGALTGSGSIVADVDNAGFVAPGSPAGIVSQSGSFAQLASGTLEIELGGLTAGTDHDQVAVTGDVTLAGTLSVSLIGGFTLSMGDSFEIIDVDGVLSGTFLGLAEGTTVGNFAGTDLFITYAGGDGNDVALFVVGLPGDYNGNGIVDAADYTVFRDNLGTDFDLNGNGDETGGSAGVVDQADYDLWVANFGETAGSGAASSSLGDSPGNNYAVPEPASLWLLLAASAALLFGLRRPPR